MASGTKTLLCAALGGMALVALVALAPAAKAQSIREQVEQQAQSSHIGDAFKSLSIFSGTPGISAANYYTDDLRLDTYKLPLSHTFEPIDGGAFDGIAPYVELTLGFLYGRQDYDLDIEPQQATRVDTTYRTFTGLTGFGLEIPVAEGLVVRPIFSVGYSRVESQASVSGPYAQTVQEAADGVLFDFSINSWLLGGAVEADYKTRFAGDLRFNAQLRYDHYADIAFKATDSSLETTGNFGVFTGGAELNGPMDARLFHHKLRWIGFGTGTGFTGPERDNLGFEYFFELGGGIEFVQQDMVRGLEGVSLRSSGLFGDGVYGWTVGLALEF